MHFTGQSYVQLVATITGLLSNVHIYVQLDSDKKKLFTGQSMYRTIKLCTCKSMYSQIRTMYWLIYVQLVSVYRVNSGAQVLLPTLL